MFGNKNNFYDGVDPEEAFLDSSNLPGFDTGAFEGRVEQPLTPREIYTLLIIFVLIIIIFLYQVFNLQIVKGNDYKKIAENNTLQKTIVFAKRGVIKDRYGRLLAWNEDRLSEIPNSLLDTYPKRVYTDKVGMYHILGYVNYPSADKSGNWWRTDFVPKSGAEKSFDYILRGHNGHKLVESSATKKILSSSILQAPVNGTNLTLTIDSELNSALYNAIKNGSNISHFRGGAGVIMDIKNGEILAMTSYPEYNSNILTDGDDRKAINAYNKNPDKPYLNRVISGTYTPGSIIKPFMATAALQEGVITENTKILSTGVLKVPNKYHPGQYTTFKDWRSGMGWLTVREAIKMSSSIFFYVVGGGFESQKGLGITSINKWAKIYGFGSLTGIRLNGEKKGIVPSPEWKRSIFGKDSVWTLGNTYHSSIGQYGWLVTPIQAVRYIASIANNGTLHTPKITVTDADLKRTVPVSQQNFKIVKEGMRMGAMAGTARALNIHGIKIAAKTGTAQLGNHNEYMNSWVVGFWPYENPQFAFAVVLEKAPAGTLRGAAPAMRPFFEWMVKNHANDYALGKYPDPKQ